MWVAPLLTALMVPGDLQLALFSPKLQDSKTDLAPDSFLSGEAYTVQMFLSGSRVPLARPLPFHLDLVTMELVLRLVFQIKDKSTLEWTS